MDWEETDEARVARHLTLLALAAECPGLDEPPLEGRAWLERLRGTDTDAAFLIRRAADLQAKEAVRSRIYDELGLMVRLAPGPGTPSRTHARYARSPFVPQAGSMRQGRPDLLAEAAVPPRDVRFVTPREGQRLIDLAREAMVTRSRDLHAFAFASPTDVRLIDAGNANFRDTRRRVTAYAERQSDFLGVGVSGGEEGARHGPSVMARLLPGLGLIMVRHRSRPDPTSAL